MAKAIINGVEINKFVVDGGGGGELATDWSKIGYDTIPEEIKAPFEHAKEIYDNWDASITNRYGEFKDDAQLVYLPVLDTSNVTNMGRMFNYAINLKLFPIQFSTNCATDMSYMFSYCRSLTSIDLSNFDTSNVTTMASMFNNCSSLVTLDLSSWNTCNVNNMSDMFSYSEALNSIDVSNWNTSTVTDMSNMFFNCSGLTSLDLSSFDTSNVNNMKWFFGKSGLLKIDGKLNMAKIGGALSATYFTGSGSNTILRKLTLTHLGCNGDNTSYDFSRLRAWGVNSTEIPDAKQSLIDSLVTHTYDRAAAGMSTSTITLYSTVKVVLTEDEIAQITAKGYTIA